MPEANYLLSVSWGYIKVRRGLGSVCFNELFRGLFLFISGECFCHGDSSLTRLDAGLYDHRWEALAVLLANVPSVEQSFGGVTFRHPSSILMHLRWRGLITPALYFERRRRGWQRGTHGVTASRECDLKSADIFTCKLLNSHRLFGLF